MIQKKKLLPFLAAGLLALSGTAVAAPIVNGTFESGSFSGWTTSGLTCSGVGSGFSGATGGCYGYDLDPGPYDGAYAAYLGTANGGGVISQSVDTVAGEAHAVDFYLAIGTYLGVSTPNSLLVTAGGDTLLSLVDAPAQGFLHYTLNFVATSGTTLLSFTHGDRPSFFILDNVSVSRVSEPGTLTLLGLGLAALGMVRLRRRA